MNAPLKKNKTRIIKAIDVFCGIGGLTHGLIKAGIPVIAGIDVDSRCKYAFEKNNNSIFLSKDIRKLSGPALNSLYGKTDIKILVGCAPCQCFSKHTQKNKNRHKDEKWTLINSFLRLIKKTKPNIISMENVTQITKRRIFKKFINTIKTLGYNVSWGNIYCPDYGVPQDRRRLVLLASNLGEIRIIKKTHPPANYKTVRKTIGRLEHVKNGETSERDRLHKCFKLTNINQIRIRQSKPGGTWLDWDQNLILPCHKKKSGKTYSAVYGRMEWDKPAPTITTQFYSYGTGRFGHPKQNRALSLREGALLQTFPKYYKFVEPNSKIAFQELGTHIGNAVPVRLGIIIGRSILKHLEEVNYGRKPKTVHI